MATYNSSDKLIVWMHLCCFYWLYIFIVSDRCHLVVVRVVCTLAILFIEKLRLPRILLTLVIVWNCLLIVVAYLVRVLAEPLVVELHVVRRRIWLWSLVNVRCIVHVSVLLGSHIAIVTYCLVHIVWLGRLLICLGVLIFCSLAFDAGDTIEGLLWTCLVSSHGLVCTAWALSWEPVFLLELLQLFLQVLGHQVEHLGVTLPSLQISNSSHDLPNKNSN